MRPARILVLRGGAIGDFIVTLPALQALRKQWPDGHIELIGYPHVAQLARHACLVDHVRSLDEARIARLFAENAVIRDDDQQYFSSFDVVVSFLHDPDGTFKGNLKRCGVKVLINQSPMVTERHATDHFLQPLESLAIYGSDGIPSLGAKPKESSVSDRNDNERPWIALHPGSGGKSKLWPIQCFKTLAALIKERTEYEVVIVTGDVEREYIPDLEIALAGYPRIHNMDLIHLADRLQKAAAFIGNDGGISHLAASVGCPTVVLFGPTRPELWAPRGHHVHVIAAPDNRMESIEPHQVWLSIKGLLGI